AGRRFDAEISALKSDPIKLDSYASSNILFAHDLIRPSFARRSGLREGGKPIPTPDHVRGRLFLDHAQRRAMLTFIGRRLLQLIPTLFFVSVMIFSLQHLLPGDPALV